VQRNGTLISESPRRAVALVGGLGVCLACLLAAVALTPRAAGASVKATAAVHFACSRPNSAKVPCYFSTPSGNIHCLWVPSPNDVTCELLATGRAYRLHPTGRAKRVKVKLTRRGETLPTVQMIVFPEKLSCQDTKTTMTCNQDEGFGSFKLAPKGSHSS
jgi:hypothetical protein